MMDKKEFFAKANEGYNNVPIFLETYADLETPLSIYLKLANIPYSYLLESVLGGERFGRYSYIGLPTKSRYEIYGKTCKEFFDDKKIDEYKVDDPIDWLAKKNNTFKTPYIKGLPRFLGGLVGYFGYETVNFIEKRLGKVIKEDKLRIPDFLFLLSNELVVLDNLSGKLFIILYANPNENNSWNIAVDRLRSIEKKLFTPISDMPNKKKSMSIIDYEFPKQKFVEAVKKAKQYIFEGDAMQIVLSQRMNMKFDVSPLLFYRSLRATNPSPYMFYFNMKDFFVVGSSPEILVRLQGDKITLRPIAGTRRRGVNDEEDYMLEKELLNDPKEKAEHVMLMDLGRNDVGRIAKVGTVKVTERMIVERYSQVMHIVSNVEGILRKEMDYVSVLKSTFPAGTVSGAPKVRAMEIIDELEQIKRGVYSGAVGYIGFNGDIDFAIALRTALIKNETLYVQAGAGIVADSDPEKEWEETINKAKALFRAAELALKGFRKIN